MTVTVETHTEEEQRELIAFLKSNKYDFSADVISLTEEQQKEVLRRDKNLTDGITIARSWDKFIQDFRGVHS